MRLRPATAADDPFLAALFRAARPDLQRLPLPAEQRDALIDMQWQAQRRGYRSNWPGAVDSVIDVAGTPVGRVLVDAGPPVTVVDIAVTPEHRGRGFATAALRQVLGEADRRGVAVTLRVARENPARRWYERLGFAVVDDTGAHLVMVRPQTGGSEIPPS